MRKTQKNKSQPKGRSTSRTGMNATAAKRTSAAKRSMVAAKSKSGVSARDGAKGKSGVSARTKSNAGLGTKARSTQATKNASGGKKSGGLLKAIKGILGKSPLKSTSEMPAKTGRANGERMAKSGGISGARKARAHQPLGTSREVNASTKPSMGNIAVSDTQKNPVENRAAPQNEKPFSGADAFKPDAKGAQMKPSTPPRKPIRQVRDQIGLRHH